MTTFNRAPKETLDIAHVEGALSSDADGSNLKAGLRGQAATDEYACVNSISLARPSADMDVQIWATTGAV